MAATSEPISSDDCGPRTSLAKAAKLLDEVLSVGVDLATNTTTVRAKTPWDVDGMTVPRPFGRDDEVLCARWMSARWNEDVRIDVVRNAVHAIAVQHRFDSIADELKVLEWDGVSRLVDLPRRLGLQDFDTHEVQQSVSAWWVGCVRRMERPHTIMRDILLVEDASHVHACVEALVSLVPFSGRVAELGVASLDARYPAAGKRLVGKMLTVVSDVSGMSPFSLECLSDFATRAEDREDIAPRRTGFALVSSTRREDRIPARCITVRPALHPEPLEPAWALQLLAEARKSAIQASHREIQHRTEDAWEPLIKSWLAQHMTHIREVGCLATSKVLRECLNHKQDRWQKSDHMRVASILASAGFRTARRTIEGGMKIRVWEPPTLEDMSSNIDVTKVGPGLVRGSDQPPPPTYLDSTTEGRSPPTSEKPE